MNVLVVANQLDRCEFNMLYRLEKLGVSFTAVLDAEQPYGELLSKSNITSIYYTIKGRINPWAIRFLRPYFKKKQFDIAHCFSSNALANVLIASAGTGIKRVAYRGTMGHINRLDPSSWLTYLNPGLHKIICVSNAVKRYFLEKNVSPNKLTTIYKGHDVSWYVGENRNSFVEFGIPEKRFIVACVANMRPVKGVDVLIEAMRLIPQELPISLLLIGDVRDDRINTLKKDPLLSSKVHFAGFRKDAPAIVGGANCFVMPSIKREGLSKALIEAMAKKVAPIISNVGGMPEVVRNGIEGLVVPPSDPGALAEAIIWMYTHPEERNHFSEASYQRICNDFNIQQTVEKTFSLYNELLCK